jgi:hypothetical protein
MAEEPPVIAMEHSSAPSMGQLQPDDTSIKCEVLDQSAGDDQVAVDDLYHFTTS